MSNSSFSAGGPPDFWAEIRAHDRVTRYRRRGHGVPLLLLYSPGDGPHWPALVRSLGEHYRVIVPEIGETGPDLSCRLAEFLEGLGCPTLSVVGNARFAGAALALLDTGCDQIARVVVVDEAWNEEERTMPLTSLTFLVRPLTDFGRLTVIVRAFLDDG